MKRASNVLSASALCLVAAFALQVRDAAAEVEAELSIIEPKEWEEDPKTMKTIPPMFKAVVVGAPPGLEPKDFQLKDDNEPPLSIKAKAVGNYAEAGEPMALVVLVQGQERWMGNEKVLEEDDPDRMEGAWAGVGPAIDALTTAGPKGSIAALLSYHSQVDTLLPMDVLANLNGGALGDQGRFRDKIGRALIAGLDEAYALLGAQTGKRRVLVVIGDGEGQQEDISGPLRKAIDQFKSIKAEVFTLQHHAVTTDSPVGMQNMSKLGYTAAKAATSRDEFASNVEVFVSMIGARFYVTFEGFNDKTAVYFVQDGQEHEYTLKVGEEEIEELTATTMIWKEPKKGGGGSLWWLWFIVLPLILIIAIVLFLVLRGGGEQVVMPQEPMMEEPMGAPAAAAAPAGPAKTIMLGLGGQDDGFPIVGWIVPLGGPHQYQTFKLLQGATKIGNAADQHIVIQDQFMSTTHAEIVCSPVGFILNDAGSTNGVFVNQKRITNHELVDNDVFTLGQTDFKFKSIN
jgi:hypothetical protein